jgi:hypothetical protein
MAYFAWGDIKRGIAAVLTQHEATGVTLQVHWLWYRSMRWGKCGT